MNPSVPTPQRIPYAQLPERTVILVGGYSVMESSHVLLRIEWRPDDARWRVSVGHVDQSKVTFIGDDVKTAKQVVRRARVHRSPVGAGWQMEPLLAIHNACEDSHKATIGGRLQMAKAYMHGSARAYGFIDSARGNDIVVRATIVDSRAARELVASRLVIDLSCYQLNSGTYTTLRKLQRPDSI
jgi:hypothetical protein